MEASPPSTSEDLQIPTAVMPAAASQSNLYLGESIDETMEKEKNSTPHNHSSVEQEDTLKDVVDEELDKGGDTEMTSEDEIDKALREEDDSRIAAEEADESSSLESDDKSSDSSDSSDISSSDSDMELPTRKLTKEEREKALIAFDEMGGDDDELKGAGEILKTMHEITDIKVRKPDIVITAEMKLYEIGTVSSIVENVVVVQATMMGEYRVLDQGSVFVWEDRSVFGEVFETFGPVSRPFYAVRFNEASEIDEERAIPGTRVFYVVDYGKYVQLDQLRNVKGSDASNRWDEEVDENEIEFSDDEAEALHKRTIKKKKKEKTVGRPPDEPYDPDDGYNILKRPPYSEVMSMVSPAVMPATTRGGKRELFMPPLANISTPSPASATFLHRPYPQTPGRSALESQHISGGIPNQLNPTTAQSTSLANATPEQLVSALMQLSPSQLSNLLQAQAPPLSMGPYAPYSPPIPPPATQFPPYHPPSSTPQAGWNQTPSSSTSFRGGDRGRGEREYH